jgi:hypothetical protein
MTQEYYELGPDPFTFAAAVVMLLIVAACGCAHNAGSLRLSTNALKAKQQILKQVPLGTSVDVAEQKMRKLGFLCQTRERGQFGDQITSWGERGEYRAYKDTDYLACSQERVIPGFSHHQWVIALVHDEHGAITNVLAQVWNRDYP